MFRVLLFSPVVSEQYGKFWEGQQFVKVPGNYSTGGREVSETGPDAAEYKKYLLSP
jgi:hypothetical protein